MSGCRLSRLRRNCREGGSKGLTQFGSGWDPRWHQPTDLRALFSDKDFRLGLNAAQTTLTAVAQLAGAAVR